MIPACESDRAEALLLREIADASLGDPHGRWVVVQLVVDDDGAEAPAVATVEAGRGVI